MIVLLFNCGYQGAYDQYRVRPEANYKIVSLFMCTATTQNFYTSSGQTTKINLITRLETALNMFVHNAAKAL
jgi:hypothetical protein